jgi:hypothetical protein
MEAEQKTNKERLKVLISSLSEICLVQEQAGLCAGEKQTEKSLRISVVLKRLWKYDTASLS